MDYVLFGMGYGATLMLVGWALRTFGPQLKYSNPPQQEDPDFLVQQRFWVRFVQGLGGVIAIAGTTMVLMTFVVVLMNPTDDTGMTIAMAIWGFVLVIVLVWCWLYLSRFGLAGIWSRANGYGFRDGGAPSVTPRKPKPAAAPAATTVAISMSPDSTYLSAPGTPGDRDVVTEAVEADGGAGDEHAEATILITESDETTPTDPVYDFGDGTETTVPSEAGGRAEALRRLRQRQARSGQSSS